MSKSAQPIASAVGPTVARYAAQARAQSLPAEVIERAKLHILDTLAAIVSGAALEAGEAGQRYAQAVRGVPVASVLGTAMRAPLVEAALANGMAAHADESDDSHEDSQTHPGCGVVPAAMVVAEEQKSSGLDLIRSVVLGYETTIRFGRAFGADMTFKSSSMSSHAYGPLFGGGYAAGCLMKFSTEQFLTLLNYLAQEASGLTTWRLDQRHTLKSYVFAGMPASNAVKTAAMVRAGFTGAGDVLDPQNRNLLDAICSKPRPEALIDELGSCFTILETDIKKYPVGYPIAAPLAALERILAEQQIKPDEVQAVRVRYNEDWYKVVGDQTLMPDVNLRYCLAVTLLDGILTFDASHDADRMAKPDVVEMGKRIKFLGPLPHLDRFATRVEVDARGKTFQEEQDRYVLGRAENPMSKAQVHDKAFELMNTVLDKATTRRAIEMVDGLEKLPEIGPLVALLCKK